MKIKNNIKVLLVYPPNQLMDVETPRPDGSLGPLYLASSLEKIGIQADILDASVGSDDFALENTFYRPFHRWCAAVFFDTISKKVGWTS